MRLSNSKVELLTDPSAYWQLIGHLLYLCLTRQDLTFLVHTLSVSLWFITVSLISMTHHLLRYNKIVLGRCFSSPKVLPYISKHLLIWIGPHVLIQESLLVDFVFSLVFLYYLGNLRSNILFQDIQQRLNIMLWLPQFVSLLSFVLYFLIFQSLILKLFYFSQQ